MSYEVMLLVLLAAVLHAVWNAIVKAGTSKLLDMAGVTIGAAILAGMIMFFVPPPAPASWGFLGLSIAIHALYFWLVAASYQSGELSVIYPLMRGSAPILTAILAVLFLHESLSLGGWVGIGSISAGILLLASNHYKHLDSLRGIFLGLITALVIVAYTVIDGIGVRAAESPWGYVLWLFFLNGTFMAALIFAANSKEFKGVLQKEQWRRNLLGGVCTIGAYGIALWAMAHAPIVLVAALRETSVIFGTIIAATFLKERFGPLRYLAASLVAAGAISLKIF